MNQPNTRRKAYVIQRVGWEYNDEYYSRSGEDESIKAFTDRTKAEQYLLTKGATLAGSPLEHGFTLSAWSTLSEVQFNNLLQDLGIPPRGNGRRGLEGWYDWWERIAGELTGEQEDRLYQAFDKLRNYQIVEVDLDQETVSANPAE